MLLAGCGVISRVDAVAEDIVTVVNPDDANTLYPIIVTELGIVIDVNMEQSWNAEEPILVTCEVGVNVTDVKPVHHWNVVEPRLVTKVGIVIDVKLEQP